MRREVSGLRTELDALAAKVRFQSQVQHDQAQVQQDQAGRIATLERGSGKGGRP
jgi:hypothetical protein